MNKNEYQDLQNYRPHPVSVIEGEDLRNQEARTLLYGYTCQRETWHVYLNSACSLRAVRYFNKGELTEMSITSNEGFVPDKRLYPEACDPEFCKMLIDRGISLPFTTFTERGPSGEGPFWGEVL